MKNNTGISLRIKELIDSVEVSANQFAKDLGYERSQSIYDILKGKSSPSYDFFNRLLNSKHKAHIDIEYLFTGKHKADIKEERESFDPHSNTENSAIKKGKRIPILDFEAYGGYGDVFAETDSNNYELIEIPSIIHNDPDFAIKVIGDSMSPLISSGDLAFCKKIDNAIFIQWGRPHVIYSLSQGTIIKNVLPSSDDEHVVCNSINSSYLDFTMPISDIQNMAMVIGTFNPI